MDACNCGHVLIYAGLSVEDVYSDINTFLH